MLITINLKVMSKINNEIQNGANNSNAVKTRASENGKKSEKVNHTGLTNNNLEYGSGNVKGKYATFEFLSKDFSKVICRRTYLGGNNPTYLLTYLAEDNKVIGHKQTKSARNAIKMMNDFIENEII